MTGEQKCIYDLFVLLQDVSDRAHKKDLTLIRPTSGIGGGIYLGMPPIVRMTDELFEKHGDIIHDAIRAKEKQELDNKK